MVASPPAPVGRAEVKLRLFTLGDAPHSMRARQELLELAQRSGWRPDQIEVIDAASQPAQALREGVIVLPTLIQVHAEGPHFIDGDLSDSDGVLRQMRAEANRGTGRKSLTGSDPKRMTSASRNLIKAESALMSLVAGGLDGILDPVSGDPILLRAAQADLLRVHHRIRNLIMRLRAVIFELDAQGGILSVNEATSAVTGYDPEELTGKNWWKTFFPDPAAADAIQAMLLARDAVGARITIIARDGGVRHLELYTSNTYLPGGALERVAGIALDLTEQIHREDARFDRELHLSQALEGARVGVWEFDAREAHLHRSEQFNVIFGVAREDAVWSLPEFMDRVASGDRERIRADFEAALAGAELDTEFQTVLPGGQIRWVAIQGRNFSDPRDRGSRLMGVVADVTGRKQTELAMAEMAAIVESSDDAVLSKDLDGTITSWNSGAEQLYGYTAEEAIGKPVSILVPPSRAAETARILEAARAGRPIRNLDTERLNKSGRVLYVTITVSPIRDATGRLVGASSVARDVSARRRAELALQRAHSELELRVAQRTADLDKANRELRDELGERHAAEEALRESELKFRSLVQSVQEAILVCDAGGTIVDSNRAVGTIFGYEAHEVIGRPFGRLLSPASRAAVQTEFARLMNTPDKEGLHQVQEVHGLRKDGGEFPIELSTAIWESGEHAYFSAMIRDISERKRVEREIRARIRQQEAVAEFGQRALSGTDLGTLMQGAVVLVAATLAVESCMILEPDSADDPHWVVSNAVGRRAGIQGFHRVSATDLNLASFIAASQAPVIVGDLLEETRFPYPPNILSEGMRSVIGVTVRTEGVVRGIIVALSQTVRRFTENDVHMVQSLANILSSSMERDRGQKLLEAAREEAERANHAKSDFLSRMSHELRTPLNAILGFGQLLELDDLSELQMESVEHILKAGRHLLELVNEVLDIAKVEAGHLELAREPIDLAGLVEESLTLIRPMAARAGVTVRNRVEFIDSRVQVIADARGLKQILLNLLSNAIKYNRAEGEVEVTVSQPSAGWARVSVRDTGPGISEVDQGKLFVPFERLGAGASEIEGTGLGLALSKRLSEVMGGRLEVASVPGEGSTFSLWVPAGSSLSPDMDSIPDAADAGPGRPPDPVQKTVLYIEDNLSNYRLVQALLVGRSHIGLMGAQEGKLGLQLARSKRPDVILLDLHLPDMNGREVLARLGDDPATREIPVIILTAGSVPSVLERPLLSQVAAYLSKPLDMREFLEVLEQVLWKESIELNSV